MLSPDLDTIRVFLHVLGAAVWVGGQIVLGAIVPRLRSTSPDSTRAVARGFAMVAWPAFVVALITGVWSLVEIGVADTTTEYRVTLFLKIVVALASAAAAAVHSLGSSKPAIALGGALGLLFGLAALFLGVTLTTT